MDNQGGTLAKRYGEIRSARKLNKETKKDRRVPRQVNKSKNEITETDIFPVLSMQFHGISLEACGFVTSVYEMTFPRKLV
ncbi:7252_t:CDS:2 [Paraglomus occultum]|uniref:7252_t:CDS:1 n=1 Tax=Paraglomus occultum TaxID=144539 RepID=A0A9N9FMJ7_9GLOM|nr:7252_t:CDS:2 [Paraglomus occultum]